MKIFKKIFAVVCALTMMMSMVTAVQAADLGYNPLSLDITDNNDNTVTVDIKANGFTEFAGATIYVKIPAALEAYITEGTWTYTTNIPLDTPLTIKDTYSTGSNDTLDPRPKYIQIGITNSGKVMTVPSDNVIVSLTIPLSEAIPATVLEADRTLTLGGEDKSTAASGKKGATAITIGTAQYFLYRTDDVYPTKKPSNYFDYDPTATGNYVVVPTAAPVVTGPTYDGYVGDNDATDEAIGAIYDFTAPEAGAKGVKWTVETNDGVTKTRVSAVDVAGGATYKLGLVIQGLAESAVKSITAVLQ